jgi:hypothetical protein
LFLSIGSQTDKIAAAQARHFNYALPVNNSLTASLLRLACASLVNRHRDHAFLSRSMCEHRRDANIQNLLSCSIFSTTQPNCFVYRDDSEQGFIRDTGVESGGNVKAPEPNATSGELEFGVHSASTTIDRYNISSHAEPRPSTKAKDM